MNNNIVIAIAVAAALYMLMGGTGNATTTTQSHGNCLQSIQAQYSAHWPEMNQVQRAMVGLRASACEGGR